MNLDSFFFKRHNEHNYNCAHFAEEVWEALVGKSVELRSIEIQGADLSLRKRFRRAKPREYPAIVLMRSRNRPLHVAVLIEQDRAIHLRASGVNCLPLQVVTLGYSSVGLYIPC